MAGIKKMTPAYLLEELLRFRQAPAIKTEALRAYNHDKLCERVKDQIETLLDSFSKYENIPYVVQGPRDQGVDVLLKGTLDDEPEEYVALQIKSHAEIADKNNDLSKNLKAGFFDAKSTYGARLQRYYILLFGDAAKHSKRISAITNEFARESLIRVITPRDLLTFIDLPTTTVSAVVDRHLSEEDYVSKTAREEVLGLEDFELHFILACLCYAFETGTRDLPDNFYTSDSRICELIEKYGTDALDQATNRFSDTDLEIYAVPASTSVRFENYLGVRALYFDLQVRYDEDSEQLFNHLFEYLVL